MCLNSIPLKCKNLTPPSLWDKNKEHGCWKVFQSNSAWGTAVSHPTVKIEGQTSHQQVHAKWKKKVLSFFHSLSLFLAGHEWQAKWIHDNKWVACDKSHTIRIHMIMLIFTLFLTFTHKDWIQCLYFDLIFFFFFFSRKFVTKKKKKSPLFPWTIFSLWLVSVK